LDDSDPGVWKEALDGLIALGAPAALNVVRQSRVSAKVEKAEWLDEAIEQISEVITDGGNSERAALVNQLSVRRSKAADNGRG
jgi:hypothetical protein